MTYGDLVKIKRFCTGWPILIYIYMEGKRCFATMFKTAKERLNYIITFLVLRFLEQCSLRCMAVLVGRAK